jgi:hypothetical protein
VQVYDSCEDSTREQPENESPQTPEVKHLNAYMNRELPATIRKRLRALLDRDSIAIEEKVESQLESIVRDALELCTRTYLNTMQSSRSPSGMTAGLAEGAASAESSSATPFNTYNMLQAPHIQTDALTQFSIPPDFDPSFMPQLPTGATLHESAYHSNTMNNENGFFNKSWLQPDSATESAFESLLSEYLHNHADFGTFAPDATLDDQPAEEYTGKGKGRANPNSNPDSTPPDFGPWVPDRSE